MAQNAKSFLLGIANQAINNELPHRNMNEAKKRKDAR
jgi:hypothetical protein